MLSPQDLELSVGEYNIIRFVVFEILLTVLLLYCASSISDTFVSISLRRGALVKVTGFFTWNLLIHLVLELLFLVFALLMEQDVGAISISQTESARAENYNHLVDQILLSADFTENGTTKINSLPIMPLIAASICSIEATVNFASPGYVEIKSKYRKPLSDATLKDENGIVDGGLFKAEDVKCMNEEFEELYGLNTTMDIPDGSRYPYEEVRIHVPSTSLEVTNRSRVVVTFPLENDSSVRYVAEGTGNLCFCSRGPINQTTRTGCSFGRRCFEDLELYCHSGTYDNYEVGDKVDLDDFDNTFSIACSFKGEVAGKFFWNSFENGSRALQQTYYPMEEELAFWGSVPIVVLSNFPTSLTLRQIQLLDVGTRLERRGGTERDVNGLSGVEAVAEFAKGGRNIFFNDARNYSVFVGTKTVAYSSMVYELCATIYVVVLLLAVCMLKVTFRSQVSPMPMVDRITAIFMQKLDGSDPNQKPKDVQLRMVTRDSVNHIEIEKQNVRYSIV